MTAESLLVDRTSLGKDPLQLEDPANGFHVYDRVAFSRVAQALEYPASSPFADYEIPTHARRTNGTYAIKIRISADNAADLKARSEDLAQAFCDQMLFDVSYTFGGITESWRCIAANLDWDTTPDWDLERVLADEFTRLALITGPHCGRGPSLGVNLSRTSVTYDLT